VTAVERKTGVKGETGIKRMISVDVDVRLPDVDIILRVTGFDPTVTAVDEY